MTLRLSFLFYFLIILGLSSQNELLEPKQNLSISNGLAHNGVTAIIEDSRGFLWVGTYDGLSKYNGYNLITYKNTVDKSILVSNRVRTLAEDKKNRIWVGTDEGVTIYFPLKEKFQNLAFGAKGGISQGKPVIRKIIISDFSDFVLCGTEDKGVLIYDKNLNYIDTVKPDEKTFGNNIDFFNGIELDSQNYLFATSKGILLFNSMNRKFQHVLKESVRNCNSLVNLSKSKLLATTQNGVVLFNFTKKNRDYKFNFLRKEFTGERFNSSIVDTSGNLWLGTINTGLFKIDKVFSFIKNNDYKKSVFRLDSGELRSSYIFESSNNVLWYGTFDEGVYRFDLKPNPFKKYNIEMAYEHAILTNSISSISVLDADRAYVVSARGGIGLFNTKREAFDPLPITLSVSDKRNIGTVYVDSKKNLWLTIVGQGLFFKPKKNNKLIKVEDVKIKTLGRIRSFAEDAYGNLWIGAMEDAFKVTVLNQKKFKIESLNSHPLFANNKLTTVRYVYVDPLYDFLWLGAEYDGLIRVKIENQKKIQELNIDTFVKDSNNSLSISSNFVSTIIRLPNEELWIGTEGGGICKVLKSDTKPEFVTFSEKQGLSNNAVKTILYDDEYNLWIGTNVGLNKFDTKALRFRKFGLSDGLPFEDFWFSSGKLKNNYLLLSGLDGLCYFRPDKLSTEELLPRLEFGDVRIFNNSIQPGDTINNRVLYKQRLEDRDEIELKYDENVFSININSLHFSNPENHYLKYRLRPLNNEWIEVPSSKQDIYYSGLQPGEYVLDVMASNSLNKWTQPKQLNIAIKPPYWKTKLAYIIYVLSSILLIYIIIKIFLRIQALNHSLEIEQLEKDKVKQINSAKLKFFSNISHELKTPLTLISSPVNNLIGEFVNRVDVKDKLEIILRQSKRISQLINQVHDFQKAEAQALKMNYSRFSFNQFIEEFSKDFEFMAKTDNKIFNVNGAEKNIIISADKDKLEKIFNNILSNAFKYTHQTDSISINYKSEDKDLIVSIKDTGKGIDKKDLSHIFERFYQSRNFENSHSSGSGIGLSFAKLLVEMHYGYVTAESELDKGTTINIRMPVVKKEMDFVKPLVEKEILIAEKHFEFKSQLLKVHNPSNLKLEGNFSETVIFYAEDNLDMRTYVTKALSKYFELKAFTNGMECLKAMEDEWPDIVISDVQMPELNGIDLCRRIKSDIKTSHIPVILLTALSNIDDKIKGIKDGADAYITKPFNIQHLLTRTEALLNNRKQLRERFEIGIPLTKENNLNNRNDNAFLEKLYDLIEDNLDNQNFDLNNFAKELYLNRTHFYQKVKALTNLTPFEVLKHYRLKKAADFLLYKKVSVNEVYIMTGFKSRTHFSRLFKEKYNVTPGKYAASKRDLTIE